MRVLALEIACLLAPAPAEDPWPPPAVARPLARLARAGWCMSLFVAQRPTPGELWNQLVGDWRRLMTVGLPLDAVFFPDDEQGTQALLEQMAGRYGIPAPQLHCLFACADAARWVGGLDCSLHWLRRGSSDLPAPGFVFTHADLSALADCLLSLPSQAGLRQPEPEAARP